MLMLTKAQGYLSLSSLQRRVTSSYLPSTATSDGPPRASLPATEPTRSLNDHVGFWQSFLMYRRFRPRARPRLPARSSGVYPVPMSTAVSARQGSRSAYRHIVG